MNTEGYSESTEPIDAVNILSLARFEPTTSTTPPSTTPDHIYIMYFFMNQKKHVSGLNLQLGAKSNSLRRKLNIPFWQDNSLRYG